MRLTEKQRQYWRMANRRWNVKAGATRSGKTWLDYYLLPKRIRACHGRDGLIVLLGNTKGTLQRNIIEPMQAIYGTGAVSDIHSDNSATLFGERVYCLGADNRRHVDRIRGSSIQYCYGDEVVTWSEDVFQMLKSRLDREYSMFDGTCNPEGPNHWFKAFLDSGADIFQQQYALDDNPFLPEAVRDSIKREYAGTVWYQRYVLGMWVKAEGAIYPMFDPARHVSADVPKIGRMWVCADIGHTNPTAFLRLGAGADGRVWALDEYYHRPDRAGARSPGRYARDMAEFAARGGDVDCVVVDPAAEGFMLQLREQSGLRVRGARNAVLEGIQLVSSALDADLVRIHPRCRNLIDEMQGYAWDPGAQERGEDRPLKRDDHACDALRYGLMERQREILRRARYVGRKE